MKLKSYAVLALWLLLGGLAFAPARVAAQESDTVLVDEVIAQVNDDAVTLSMVNRELSDAVEALKASGVEEAKAREEVEKNRAKIIASLIDEQLLAQKAKDLGMDAEIEAALNKELLRLTTEYKVRTLDELYDLMRRSGADPEAVRRTLRSQITRSFVIGREVDARVFYGSTPAELQAFFNKNPDKFKRPEVLDISEIFLNLAGRNAADLRVKAAGLVTEARAGKNFGELALAHSERANVRETQGKVGKVETTNLQPKIATALKNVAVGGVSEPVEIDEGILIFRVNERVGSVDTPVFNEDAARQLLAAEKVPQEREIYLQTLRSDAYIKIANDYRALLEPLVFKAAPVTPAAVTSNDQNRNKNKKDKNNKDNKDKNN